MGGPTVGGMSRPRLAALALAGVLGLSLAPTGPVAASPGCQPGPRAQCAGADLHGMDLHNRNLAGADFRGANLAGANLHAAQLTGASLVGANLFDATLTGSALNSADLSYADLREADLGGAALHGTTFAGAQLGRAVFRDASFLDTVLSHAHIGETHWFPSNVDSDPKASASLFDRLHVTVDASAGSCGYAMAPTSIPHRLTCRAPTVATGSTAPFDREPLAFHWEPGSDGRRHVKVHTQGSPVAVQLTGTTPADVSAFHVTAISGSDPIAHDRWLPTATHARPGEKGGSLTAHLVAGSRGYKLTLTGWLMRRHLAGA